MIAETTAGIFSIGSDWGFTGEFFDGLGSAAEIGCAGGRGKEEALINRQYRGVSGAHAGGFLTPVVARASMPRLGSRYRWLRFEWCQLFKFYQIFHQIIEVFVESYRELLLKMTFRY